MPGFFINTYIINLVKFIYIISFLLIVSACNRKTTDRVVAPPKIEPLVIELDSQIIDNEPIVEIPERQERFIVASIEKESCYRNCPVYSLSLHSDGLAFYTCKIACKPYGIFHGYIGSEKLELVKKFIENKKLLELQNFYPTNNQPVPEIPLTKISVALSEKFSLEIQNYHHAPVELLEFEKLLDEIISDTKWENSYE